MLRRPALCTIELTTRAAEQELPDEARAVRARADVTNVTIDGETFPLDAWRARCSSIPAPART